MSFAVKVFIGHYAGKHSLIDCRDNTYQRSHFLRNLLMAELYSFRKAQFFLRAIFDQIYIGRV